MRNKIIKIMLISFIILTFSSCSTSKTEDSNIKDIDAAILINTSKNISNLYKDKHYVELDKKVMISNAIISDDATIPVMEIEGAKSVLYLLNLKTGVFEKIIDKDVNIAYGFSYQDEEILIFYEYNTDGMVATPIDYYIFHKNDKKIVNIGLQELQYDDLRTVIDSKISRFKNEIYFELQDRDRVTDSEGRIKDNGISVYKYNLVTNLKEKVAYGMSPRIIDNEVYYLKANEFGGGNLINLNTEKEIISDIIEYEVYENKIVYARYDGDNKITYLFDGDVEKEIFTRDHSISFWNYKMNEKYISWHQIGNNVYIYDIKEEDFILVSDDFSSNFSIVSNKYIYWMENEINKNDKSDVKNKIVYIDIS